MTDTRRDLQQAEVLVDADTLMREARRVVAAGGTQTLVLFGAKVRDGDMATALAIRLGEATEGTVVCCAFDTDTVLVLASVEDGDQADRIRRRLAPVVRESTRPHARGSAAVLDLLDRSLRGGTLTCVYQPIRSLWSGDIVAAEALARLPDAEGGWVPPATFIPTAERTDRIAAVGRHIVEDATMNAAGWSLRHPEVGVSVNVSVAQLRDTRVFEDVCRALDRSGLPPERLTLEVTESIVVDDASGVVEALVGLRAIGVKLALDDFGAGYSSLSHLQRLPVDAVKLDRSLLAGPSASVIVPAAVELAHAMHLEVVIEGIETPDQLDLALRTGADRGQGYLLGRPMTHSDLVIELDNLAQQ